MMVDTPVALSVSPSSGPEFTYVPSPGVAIPDSAGSGWPVEMTSITGSP